MNSVVASGSRTPTVEDLQYAAAILDGEGHFEGFRDKQPPCVVISMSDKGLPALRKVFACINGGKSRIYSCNPLVSQPRARPTSRLRITSDEPGYHFLSSVLPYMSLKRRQAEITLAGFAENMNERARRVGRRRDPQTNALLRSYTKQLLEERANPTPYEVRSISPAYMAGIIDGEGGIFLCVYKKRTPAIVQVSIGMCEDASGPLIAAIHRQFGGTLRRNVPGKENTKPLAKWISSSRNVIDVIEYFEPHLAIKSEQAHLAASYMKLVSAIRLGQGVRKVAWPDSLFESIVALKERMNHLNRVGLDQAA